MPNFITLLATLRRDQGKCIIFTEGTMEQLTSQCSHQRYNVIRLITSPLEAIKGQMNKKIDIFSFVALPSPNTKKNHPR